VIEILDAPEPGILFLVDLFISGVHH